MKNAIRILSLMFSLSTSAGGVKVSSLKELTFKVETNFLGHEFEGHIIKEIQIRSHGSQQTLTLDLKSMKTGSEKRDLHMYEKIFSHTPPVFRGVVLCQKMICKIVGELTIGKTSKKVEIKANKEKTQFKFSHKLKLSEFSINAPEFLGVKVLDEITINGRIQ